MKFLTFCALAVALAHHSSAASDSKPKHPKPCTIESPSSHSFFDLNSISVLSPLKDTRDAKGKKLESWHARGYDYGANFTLNFCAPVVEDLEDVVGVEKGMWRNVSAYYTKSGKAYSIGQQNSELVFRGRKLVLNYTDGSPCASSSRKRSLHPHQMEDLLPRALNDHDDDEDDDDDDNKHSNKDKDKRPKEGEKKDSQRRKTTIISFMCDRDPLAPKASLSFIGAVDECTYFFEARSLAACAGAETAQQQLGAGGVFGFILFFAILAYLVGGCVYQRTVMHQRGWRQLPNYSMWAGIGSFVMDIFIILTSSCARFLPGRRGYSRVSLTGNERGRGRSNHADDENRLIDQLDEEWDD